MVRLAVMNDMDRILDIYELARAYMKEKGNPTQWGDSYPEILMLLEDISKQQLFVIEEADQVVGCFVLAGGEDETYAVIDHGEWRLTDYYGTIHRIASDGSASGIFSKCMEYAREHYDYVRVDTHADNYPMQAAVLREGFVYTGIIYTYDGTSRKAYDWLKNDKNN